jgi:predicted Zn-dependent protease
MQDRSFCAAIAPSKVSGCVPGMTEKMQETGLAQQAARRYAFRQAGNSTHGAAADPDAATCDMAVFDIAPAGLDACLRMVEKRPNDSYWKINLIGAYAARKKMTEAQAELDKALAAAPNAQERAEIESAAADILSATSGR